MSRVLFANQLQPRLDETKADGRGTCWSQLQAIVAKHVACPIDRVVRFDTDKIRRERQYDKSEQVITCCLLAALSLATENFGDKWTTRSLLSRGFSSSASIDTIVANLGRFGWTGLRYEALICPSNNLRQVIQSCESSIPIAYLREVAQKTAAFRFESPTHLDVFFGNQTPLIAGSGDVGFGLKAKFTSDIDSHTTYSTHRNQLVRSVEVGHGQFERFFFTLITPRRQRERRSWFYVYRAEEFLGVDGPAALMKDCLVPPSPDAGASWQERIGYLCWEDIDHEDADALSVFLKERRLL